MIITITNIQSIIRVDRDRIGGYLFALLRIHPKLYQHSPLKVHHLDERVAPVDQVHFPVVYGDGARRLEVQVPADSPDEFPFFAEHLDALVVEVSNVDVVLFVHRDGMWSVEVSFFFSVFAEYEVPFACLQGLRLIDFLINWSSWVLMEINKHV